MEEEQEMERFDMENDYEGGRWIGDEFLYKSKRQKKKPNKEDAIYGSFANSSSSSDSDNRLSKKKSKRDLPRKPDFSKPIHFISTGPVLPNQPIEESAPPENPNPSSGDDEEDESFLPTAFGRKIKEAAAQRREREREKLRSEKNAGGRKEAAGSFKEVGKFENHTRGIGLKLMEKMGYKLGTGLGKSEQGISVPVEAKLRPKGMGMGFNDYEEAKLPALDEAVNDAKPDVVREKRWLRQKKQGRKNVEFLTADALLARKQEQGLEVFQQKILDMRGPQTRVLSNLENLNAEVEAKEDQAPMPELQHNVRLIVDMAENDILKIDGQLRRERESVVSLRKEEEKLRKEASRQKRQLEAMEAMANMVRKVDDDNMSGVLTLESLLRTFGDLKERFAEDYKLFNVSCIACSFAIPLLIRVFQGWEPLQNPSHGLAVMSSWRDLLHGDQQPFDYSDDVVSTSPYAHLVGEVILPAVRISGTNS